MPDPVDPMLTFVKAWCRVDDTRFDAILPSMIAAAVALAEHETGRNYTTEEDMPDPVQTWCAAHVAYWLDNPAAANERQMMPSPFLSGLLDPYRLEVV